ncbi:Uncharacterised protein [Mycobacteroides abscessus subsp. abscessus]|nr:Uncharacterised protein [Mycobacteroides abscessus subsp. abscessus]
MLRDRRTYIDQLVSHSDSIKLNWFVASLSHQFTDDGCYRFRCGR